MTDETAKGTGSAVDFLPSEPSLERMQLAVQDCRGCRPYSRATQAVFGKGTPGAELMLVGEQPGDKEDLAGEPSVGPSGKLLDTTLAEAGIERYRAYATNVVTAQAILGASFRVSRHHGRFFESELGPLAMATVHPSAILRSDDRPGEMRAFIADLRLAAEKLGELRGGDRPGPHDRG